MDPDFVEAVREIRAQSYADVAMTAIVAFEYLITFDQEVECVWKRKFSATSVLLLTTRWVMIVNQSIVWMPATPVTNCITTYAPSTLFYLLSLAQIALFAGFRVYALWYNWKYKFVLLAVVLALGFVPVATNIFGWANIVLFYQDGLFGCEAYINVSDELNLIMLQLTRSCALAADIIVLIATWLRTFTQWREARRLQMRLSASSLLLRDGTIYFIALLAMNVAQMATFWDTSINANIANVPLTSMPNVLVNRFLINLRQLNKPTNSSSTALTDETSGLTFAAPATTALGNIGEPLEYEFGGTNSVSETSADSLACPEPPSEA